MRGGEYEVDEQKLGVIDSRDKMRHIKENGQCNIINFSCFEMIHFPQIAENITLL